MTTIVPYVHNTRTQMNGDMIVNNGVIGEPINITATGDISLVPGVTPGLGLTKYYNSYIINTNAIITVTLPSPIVAGIGNVALGWYCRIDLVSTTGVGAITIVDHLTQVVGRLNANTTVAKVLSSAVITLVEATPVWCAAYGLPSYGTPNQMATTTSTGIQLRRASYGKMYSLTNGSVDVNTTVDIALPWNNATNLVLDTNYFSFAGANSRINFLTTGMYRIYVTIGINIVLLATLTNLRIRPRVNGVTFLSNFTVYNATILPYASGVYWLDCINYFTAGDYVEIMVGKSATSIGSNPTDSNTAIIVELVGQT